MKGIILAGGKGTRLRPLTTSVNKHLLPVYDKPLIFWPVMTLVRAGIGDIMVVCNPEDVEKYQALLSDGDNLGVRITYGVQESANGIGGALAVAEEFAKDESVAVILGDNVFLNGEEVRDGVADFKAAGERGAMIFLKEVPDPERFGVAEVEGMHVRRIEEKPIHPVSNLAVTGLYLFDADVFELVRKTVPSARGEFEITDVNNLYLSKNELRYKTISGAWIDAGTHESLLRANALASGLNYDHAKKTKILFAINKLAVGGAEHLVLHQIKGINKERFDAHLLTLVASTEPNLDSEAAWLGKKWQKFAFKGFTDIASFVRLYRYLRKERFDVVLSSLFFANTVVRAAAFLARVPVMYAYEVNAKADGGKLRLFIEQFLARRSTKMVVNSKEVLDFYMGRLRLPRERFALMYSGIDLAAHTFQYTPNERTALRSRYGLAANDVVITTGGRLIDQKGHTYLIDAFAALHAHRPNTKLVIFGEGALREGLLSQIEKLGLEGAVQLPGVAPVRDIIGISDIFTLPSLWEGMSLMLLEAMAGGVPVVATNVSGTRELITQNENGYLVPAKDVSALTEKLEALVADETLRTRFAKASIKEVQKFSIESNLITLYSLINESL
jgi:glucose-1-phosphate thymidylyltransferase